MPAAEVIVSRALRVRPNFPAVTGCGALKPALPMLVIKLSPLRRLGLLYVTDFAVQKRHLEILVHVNLF